MRLAHKSIDRDGNYLARKCFFYAVRHGRDTRNELDVSTWRDVRRGRARGDVAEASPLSHSSVVCKSIQRVRVPPASLHSCFSLFFGVRASGPLPPFPANEASRNAAVCNAEPCAATMVVVTVVERSRGCGCCRDTRVRLREKV